jgi:hypothetical protein
MARPVSTSCHEVLDHGTNYMAVVNVAAPGVRLHRHISPRWTNVVIVGAGSPCSIFANDMGSLAACRCFSQVIEEVEFYTHHTGDFTNGTHVAFLVLVALTALHG